MAKVSLRIYNREVESLIEHGQLDEAIAHCQHILKTFPKHLETYRLLGKAYLEAKRYTAAVDLFQRILMAAPDDFVSHVGMSIIRDDENKLDEAIWHMERAFEVQPSNAAIQGELQRLFGRRDGVEPPKIRMTRGALAHMYIQGELYSQAISEVNAVLKQDPQRMDMQVLLALAYFRAGQKADASDLCNQLLKRAPYCFDANRILVEILPGTQKPEATQTNRQRVNELDPYAAFAPASVFRSADVPDSAVNLERLEYSGQSVQAGAEWNSSLGIGLGAGTAAALASSVPEAEPDWLKSSTSTPPLPAASASALEEKDEESIPDFLRQAGWGESTGAFQEGALTLDEPEAGGPGPISQADLPDWIKAMQPGEPEPAPPAEPAARPAPASDPLSDSGWLRSLGGEQALDSGAAEQAAAGSSDAPDWLRGLGADEPASVQPSFSAPLDDTPDWLKGLGTELPAQTEATGAGSQDDAPDWLKGLGMEGPATASQGSAAGAQDEAPDWLNPKPAGMPAGAQPGFPPADFDEPPPSDSPPGPDPAAYLGSLGTSVQEQDDAMAWLEGLASKHGAKPEELVTDPNARSEIAPEWVDKAKAIGDLEPEPQLADTPPGPDPAAYLGNLGTSSQEQDDAMAWLESLASKHGAKPEELVTDPNVRSEIAPEWVDKAKAIGEPPADAQPIQPAPENPDDETGIWLKGLREQGTRSKSSEWIGSFDEPEQAPASIESSEPAFPLASEEFQTSTPAEASATPDWLSELQSTQGETPAPAVEEAAPAEAVPAASLPDWLSGLENDTPAPAAGEDLPSWLADEMAAEQPPAEPTRPDDWQPIDMGAAAQPPVERAPEPAQPKQPAQSAPRSRPSEAVAKETGLDGPRAEMGRGNIAAALNEYGRMIRKGRFLDEIIYDLREAIYRYPVEVPVWQALGDAYMRANRLQEALDAYTKAEELLR